MSETIIRWVGWVSAGVVGFLLCVLMVSVLSAKGSPPVAPPSELCAAVTTDGREIGKVRAVIVCTQDGERLLATYNGETVVLRWGRTGERRTGKVETFWMEARCLASGGAPMPFEISYGESVSIAEVPGFSVSFLGDPLDVARRYVIKANRQTPQAPVAPRPNP